MPKRTPARGEMIVKRKEFRSMERTLNRYQRLMLSLDARVQKLLSPGRARRSRRGRRSVA